MSLEYYVMDTETTGLKAGWHEITEISIIRCSDRHQLTEIVRSDFPERASEQALNITGKSISDILSGKDKEEVVMNCNKFFEQDGLTPEHRCMICHNAAFDKRFCHALWESVRETFPAVCWLDTMKASKEWALKIGKQPENYKLGTLVKFAGVKSVQGIHNAESDARNLYILWKKAIENQINHVPLIKRIKHEFSD